ncbi:MAG: hypothetical protein IPF46_10645 [Saprospiraceae bacterium]|nr:hypothetical protein [Candidatus Vicinibacter affinis]MBK6571637.1 hypothetical protein [Candidatus Vicinibacter affinis]MBK6822904.1 hypothetical protein [Candidatus Vicinibacter affinis]MBK7799593.1 hypothetical protein [Candidatus Vicinibacter affinis]MBP6172200.1 hypothetical protein [Saprospiraceae bacterium]
MPSDPDTTRLFLGGAKDLLKEHPHELALEKVDIQIFHNKEMQYSGIQLGRFQGSPEWTAIGYEAVKALELWYRLFQAGNTHLLQNTVRISECYTPSFLPYQKKYATYPFLVSDEVAKELNSMEDRFMRLDRLEKYLYGNLQTFFHHINYEYSKDANYLKVSIIDAAFYQQALVVYHDQKKTAFRIVFKCNFRLPQTMRLGQSTAVGFGPIHHV